MSSIAKQTFKTGVKFLNNTVIFLTASLIVLCELSYAQTTPAPATAPATQQAFATCDNIGTSDSVECMQKKCDQLAKEAAEANTNITNACKEAKLSGGTDACIEKAIACEVIPREVSDEKSQPGIINNLVNMFLKSKGLNASADLGKTNSKSSDPGSSAGENDCSITTSDDYRTQRKELDDKISELQKDIDKEQKELNDLQKEAQNEVSELQDKSLEDKAETELQQSKLSETLREKISDYVSRQKEIKNELNNRNLELIKLRGELTKMESQHSQELMQINDDNINYTCSEQYRKAIEDNTKKMVGPSSPQSRMNFKKFMKKKFVECRQMLENQRVFKVESYRSSRQEILARITNAQTAMNEAEASVSRAQSDLSAIEAQNKAEGELMSKNLLSKMQSTQNKMQAKSANIAQQQLVSNSRNEQINKEIKEIQNKIARLGKEPPTGATIAEIDVKIIIQNSANEISSFMSSPFCCESSPTATSKSVGPLSGGNSICKNKARFEKYLEKLESNSSRSNTNKSERPAKAGLGTN